MAQGSDTKLYIALGVLGVLGIGYFMQAESAKKEEAAHSIEAASKELPSISLTEEQTGKITKIEIQKPGKEGADDGEGEAAQTNVLVKEGDTWNLQKPVTALANQKNVESLLKNLTKLEVKEQVGANKETYGQFDVSDDKAVVATFYAGDQVVRKIWAGKSGGRGQIARVDGSDGVFVLEGYSSFLYSRNTKGWRDTSIFELDTEEVKSVSIENENGEFSFVKGEGDDAWESKFKAKKAFSAKPVQEFDPKKVKNMLNAYKKLNATGFGDQESVDSTGLSEPQATLTIELADGGKKEVLFGETSEGSSRWAKLPDKDQIYAISSWASDWAFADEEKFQETKQEDAAPGNPGMPPGMPGMPPGMPQGMPPGHP